MTTSERNVVLHVDDVSKNFGGLRLSDIDLEVEQGKTHAIIGPNGAGNPPCSTSSSAARADQRRRGVRWPGAHRPEALPDHQLGVARVFQTPEIFPELTVLVQNVGAGIRQARRCLRVNVLRSVDGEALRDEAEAIIEDVGLSDRRLFPCRRPQPG